LINYSKAIQLYIQKFRIMQKAYLLLIADSIVFTNRTPILFKIFLVDRHTVIHLQDEMLFMAEEFG
jgi:hypothetical protein